MPCGGRYWTVLDDELAVVGVAGGVLRHGRLVPGGYDRAEDGDLPTQVWGEDVGMSWRLRARHRVRVPETRVDRASDAEIVALLRACRNARDRLIVLLLARAGLRRGEAAGL